MLVPIMSLWILGLLIMLRCLRTREVHFEESSARELEMAKKLRRGPVATVSEVFEVAPPLLMRIASFAQLSTMPALAATSSWLNEVCADDGIWLNHLQRSCPALLAIRAAVREPAPCRSMVKQFFQKQGAQCPKLRDFEAVLSAGGRDCFSMKLCEECECEYATEVHGVAADMLYQQAKLSWSGAQLPPIELLVAERNSGAISRLRFTYGNGDTRCTLPDDDDESPLYAHGIAPYWNNVCEFYDVSCDECEPGPEGTFNDIFRVRNGPEQLLTCAAPALTFAPSPPSVRPLPHPSYACCHSWGSR